MRIDIPPSYFEVADERLAAHVPSSAQRILDVDCASGALAMRLKEGRPDREIWGIERSEEMASEARRNGVDRVIVGDVERMASFPLPKDYFDCIICSDILEALRHPSRCLESLHDHLRPSGSLLCRVSNKCHWSFVVGLLSGGHGHESDLGPHGFAPPTVLNLLFASGYGIVAEDRLAITNPEVIAVLTSAAEALGADAESSRRNLNTYQLIYEAKKVLPRIDFATSGVLGEGVQGLSSIIVVAYNSASTIAPCLASLLATIGDQDEIIVVDNASGDDTCGIVLNFANRDPRVQLIRSPSNLGFAKGSNLGLSKSKGEYLALVNPDVVVTDGWLGALQKRLDLDGVGLAGPLSDNIAGDQFVGHYVRGTNLTTASLSDICRENLAGSTLWTKLLIGLCVMAKRSLLDQIGLLDEDLFLGSDDLELSWRIRTHGLRLAVAMDAFVHHKGGVSFASQPKDLTKQLVFESTECLLSKIRETYGWVPSSVDIWGVDIIHK
ncbi:MAG: glycosyltransferase [Armatimonadetes bacterium]|nr:glycosyltransferase [Armatimonadota bacterium]